jgi:hypothetical protein
MIIELVGLPGAGKTHLAKALENQGAVIARAGSRKRMLIDAICFVGARPFFSIRLLIAIVRRAPKGFRYSLVMNGFVVNVSKWRSAKRLGRRGRMVIIDQGFAQLVVSLAGLPEALLVSLPKPTLLALVEAPEAAR